jgi:hypothetical protein
MTKTQKEVLAEIENGGVHAASDWAFTAAMGKCKGKVGAPKKRGQRFELSGAKL